MNENIRINGLSSINSLFAYFYITDLIERLNECCIRNGYNESYCKFLEKVIENVREYEINPLIMSFALDNFVAHADNIYGYKE